MTRIVSWFRHRILALSILAVSLGVTWTLWRHEQHNAALDLSTQLDGELRDAGNRITQRMQTSAQMLRGAQGLFAAAGNVGHKEFRAYVEALQLGPDFSGIQGIGTALIVPHARKTVHVAALRKQGFPEYTIKPTGERAVYAPITQMEPFIGTNQRALGFDPHAISTRRVAMELSRDSGAATITGKIKLVLNTDTDDQSGFVMFLPLFKPGMPRDTMASRRANIIGWVTAPIRMNNFMASLYGERSAATDISIYDGVDMTDETLLYDTAGSHGKTESTKVDAVEYIQVAGHTWTLAIRALPGFAARAGKDKSEFIVIAGIGLSLLLALLTSNLVTSRERARIQARALRETKEHFETIFDASPDSVLITRLSDGVITEVNHAFTANTGYARDESIGHSTLDLDTWTNLDDRRRCIGELREKGYTKNVEAQFRKKDGTLHTGIVSARVVALRGAEHAIWIIRDITARKRTEDALHQSEERLALILACANLGTWDWDLKTGGFVSNQHWADLRGLRQEEVESHVSSWEKGIHPDDLPGLRRMLADHLDNRSQIFEAEYRIHTQSGGWIWVLDRGMVVGRDAEGNPLRIAGIEMDVTERKLNEARMSALSKHLVELQEDARTRLAGELHDRTSPNLAAIGINLDVMAATLLNEGSPTLSSRLDDTRALIEDTTASIREICADLRPPVLDYAGLPAALESYANQFSRRTGIPVQVECAHPVVRLSSELESTLFRIAQEALTNCAKHSRATSIRVALDQAGRSIVLTVADNGIGFDPDMLRTAMRPGGLGTITMKDLTEFSGGTFNLESSSGKGTRIRVELDSSKGPT